MSNVTPLRAATKLDLPVDNVLDGAKTHDLQEVVVIGALPDGTLYLASSGAQLGNVSWLLECAKHEILKRAHTRPMEPVDDDNLVPTSPVHTIDPH